MGLFKEHHITHLIKIYLRASNLTPMGCLCCVSYTSLNISCLPTLFSLCCWQRMKSHCIGLWWEWWRTGKGLRVSILGCDESGILLKTCYIIIFAIYSWTVTSFCHLTWDGLFFFGPSVQCSIRVFNFLEYQTCVLVGMWCWVLVEVFVGMWCWLEASICLCRCVFINEFVCVYLFKKAHHTVILPTDSHCSAVV